MVLAAPINRLVSLAEIAFSAKGESRVDADAGVIYGVKVLGLESKNTGKTIGLTEQEFGPAANKPYCYTLEALRAAAPQYEGVRVYVDHPEFSYDASGKRTISRRERKTGEGFGRLVNVRVTESGMFADLEYLKSHPLAEMVAEAAQRMPETLALSHNAGGRPELRNGRIVIAEIGDVRSVDLVSERPGTTHSLFESADPAGKGKVTVKITLRQLFEAADPKAASRPLLAKLLEMDAPMGDVSMEYAGEAAPTVEAPASEDAVLAGLKAAVMAKLEKADAAKWQAVLAALEMSDSVAELATGKKSGDAADDKAKTAETAAAAIETAKAGERATLLESVGLLTAAGQPANTVWLESMRLLETKEKRQEFVASLPKPSGTGLLPRSQSPKVPVTETAPNSGKQGLDVSTTTKARNALRGL